MNREAIYSEIERERLRQNWLRDEGKFVATLAETDALYPCQKHAVLAEEVGEVARCCLAVEKLVHEPTGVRELRTELLQVAALAVAWIESLPDPEPTGTLDRAPRTI